MESLCSQSRRRSATRACWRATLARALARLLLPLALRLRVFCIFLSFFSARRRKRGESTLVPSASTAKWPRPRSIPVSVSSSGRNCGSVSTTNDAQYLLAAFLVTVTDVGTAGSCRDQRTRRSPTLATYSLPLSRREKPLAVSRIDCWLSRFDLKRGGATFGPLRLPAWEEKKFRAAAPSALASLCGPFRLTPP